jgi:hypothetical protein
VLTTRARPADFYTLMPLRMQRKKSELERNRRDRNVIADIARDRRTKLTADDADFPDLHRSAKGRDIGRNSVLTMPPSALGAATGQPTVQPWEKDE